MRYRIPLEFEAANDDEARLRVTQLDRELNGSYGVEPLVVAELARAETYWKRVETQ